MPLDSLPSGGSETSRGGRSQKTDDKGGCRAAEGVQEYGAGSIQQAEKGMERSGVHPDMGSVCRLI